MPTVLMLLMYPNGGGCLKFGPSNWHGRWHFDMDSKILRLAFNHKCSGYILKDSVLLLVNPSTLSFEGNDQWGNRIELKFDRRWKLVNDPRVPDTA